MNILDLPKTIPVFPLSNFIMFPGTTVPLNIFEPRYLQMVNDSMKKHRMIGMIQPKKSGILKKPDLHEIGCIGKITSFNETEDGRILIILNGICRFKLNSEIETVKLYRECNVQYSDFTKDLSQTINDLSMASPFSLEEKQILLESIDINTRKEKMEQILNNYIKDEFENTTIQ